MQKTIHIRCKMQYVCQGSGCSITRNATRVDHPTPGGNHFMMYISDDECNKKNVRRRESVYGARALCGMAARARRCILTSNKMENRKKVETRERKRRGCTVQGPCVAGTRAPGDWWRNMRRALPTARSCLHNPNHDIRTSHTHN